MSLSGKAKGCVMASKRRAWSVGVFLTLGLGACVPMPHVIVTPPAREPITNLDAMEAGQTEVSGSLGLAVATDGEQVEVGGLDYPSLGSPWTLAAAHSFRRVELRGAFNQTLLWNQGNLGVGVRLPSIGAWDFVVDGGYAFGRYESQFTIEEDDTHEAALARGPGTYDYAYRNHAPYGRARATYRVNDRISLPMSVRMAHGWTEDLGGVLPQELKQQSFPELSAGLVYSAQRGCLQAGLGVHYTVLPDVVAPQVQGALSCVFDVQNREMGR